MNWATLLVLIGAVGSGAIGSAVSGVLSNRGKRRDNSLTTDIKQREFEQEALAWNRAEWQALAERVSQLEIARNAAETLLNATRDELDATRLELSVVVGKLAEAERRLANTQHELHAAQRKAERLQVAMRASGVPVPDGI